MTIQDILTHDIRIGLIEDTELCELIDNAPDWEFCWIHGLLEELTYRTGIDFVDHNSGEFDDALVYEAMAKLGYEC